LHFPNACRGRSILHREIAMRILWDRSVSSGTGSTVIENTLEDRINCWLRRKTGKVVFVTQSNSEGSQAAHSPLEAHP